MSTKHLSSRKMLFVPNNSDSIHTRVQVHLDNTSLPLLSACWGERKILSLFSPSAPAEIWDSGWKRREHISLFQIYQLYVRWSRDDPSPADWRHTMHFPGCVLRANCSVASASRVLAELQAPSALAFMLVQNQLQIILQWEKGEKDFERRKSLSEPGSAWISNLKKVYSLMTANWWCWWCWQIRGLTNCLKAMSHLIVLYWSQVYWMIGVI